jgi:hypothetical protein
MTVICSSRAAASLWVFGSAVPAELAKDFCRERRLSRHANLTDSDVGLGCFRHEGFAALMAKLSCRVRSGTSLPNSFPLTGSPTPVPSGNGGEENCISVSAAAHAESSPQSKWWSAKTLQCKL